MAAQAPIADLFSRPARHIVSSRLFRVSTMDKISRRQKRQDNVLSSLNVAIESLNLTKEILNITPAKAVCGSVNVVLVMIKVRSP